MEQFTVQLIPERRQVNKVMEQENNGDNKQTENLEELIAGASFDEEQLEELQFEEALERLEVIVDDLDGDNISLDDSLEKFIEGVHLVKFCNRKLEQAEKKIEIVVKDDEQFAEIVPFDNGEEEEA